MKGKEEYLCSAILVRTTHAYSESAQTWITQFYLRITLPAFQSVQSV